MHSGDRGLMLLATTARGEPSLLEVEGDVEGEARRESVANHAHGGSAGGTKVVVGREGLEDSCFRDSELPPGAVD